MYYPPRRRRCRRVRPRRVRLPSRSRRRRRVPSCRWRPPRWPGNPGSGRGTSCGTPSGWRQALAFGPARGWKKTVTEQFSFRMKWSRNSLTELCSLGNEFLKGGAFACGHGSIQHQSRQFLWHVPCDWNGRSTCHEYFSALFDLGMIGNGYIPYYVGGGLKRAAFFANAGRVSYPALWFVPSIGRASKSEQWLFCQHWRRG